MDYERSSSVRARLGRRRAGYLSHASSALAGVCWLAALGAVQPAQAQVKRVLPPTQVFMAVDGINLVPSQIALNANNHVAFTIVNAGRTAVTQPFVSDVYVNGVRRDTYKHGAQGAQASASVVSALAHVDSCTPAEIKIVTDAQQVVPEANEADNTRAATVTPRCPDLVITEVKQDWQDANTRYRIQVKVQNIGDLTMPSSVIARAWGGQTGALAGLDPSALPILDNIQVAPLAPGQSAIFHLSTTFLGTDAVQVKIYLDFQHQIVEKSVANNLATKTFGPH